MKHKTYYFFELFDETKKRKPIGIEDFSVFNGIS